MTKKSGLSGLIVVGGLAAALAAPHFIRAAQTPPGEERDTDILTAPIPVRDHGKLIGLGDDDHPQYLLADGTREAAHLIITDGEGHYLQVPQLTTAQRDALTPVNGMVVYNTTTTQFERYQAGAWGAFGITDHGGLTGLADDDHGQYLNIARHDLVARHPAAVLGTHGAAQHTNVTRELFIPAYGYTTGAVAFWGLHSSHSMADNLEKFSVFSFKVPDDFVSFVSVEACWGCTAATGNMYWKLHAYYGASGEAYGTHEDLPSIGATATGGANILNVQEPLYSLTLASLAVGDYLGIQFLRQGQNIIDSLQASVELIGLLFTYTAEQ